MKNLPFTAYQDGQLTAAFRDAWDTAEYVKRCPGWTTVRHRGYVIHSPRRPLLVSLMSRRVPTEELASEFERRARLPKHDLTWELEGR